MNEGAHDKRVTYRIPESTLTGHTNEALLDRLRGFETWCAELGVQTRGTRIERYRRYLENFQGIRLELDRGVFFDPPESPMRHGLDRYLYVLREVHELTWISQSLRGIEVKGAASKLAKVVGGSDFAALDRNSDARNTQFELRIAGYFGRGGFQVDLETLTDIVATKRRMTYHVECKRIASGKQVERRLKEAARQLRLRVPRSSWRRSHLALIAADVTKVAFGHNGLTIAVTPEHSKDIVQRKLGDIGAEIGRSASVDLAPACALWLQIHISSQVLIPLTPVTRFSNYVLPNPRGGWRLRRASDQFRRMFCRIDTSESGDWPAAPLQPRSGILVPAGVQIAPDMDLLRYVVSKGFPPDLPDEHLVLSVLRPDGGDKDWLNFSFFEFKWMFDGLSPEERLEFTSSTESAMQALLGRLLLQRYPYKGEPIWLDKPT